jgi:hypothetical protein
LESKIGDRSVWLEIVPDGTFDRLGIEMAVDEELEEAHALPGDVKIPSDLHRRE